MEIIIYGKDGWPYTAKAREAYGDRDVTYIDVKANDKHMQDMLAVTDGVRSVPVIVKGNEITIGYGGTWAVWSWLYARNNWDDDHNWQSKLAKRHRNPWWSRTSCTHRIRSSSLAYHCTDNRKNSFRSRLSTLDIIFNTLHPWPHQRPCWRDYFSRFRPNW